MNQPGEIEPLATWLQPEWAIMTEIGPAHYAHFNSVEAIVDEKAALLRALPVEGVAILDKDSPWYETLEASTEARDRCEPAQAGYGSRRLRGWLLSSSGINRVSLASTGCAYGIQCAQMYRIKSTCWNHTHSNSAWFAGL